MRQMGAKPSSSAELRDYVPQNIGTYLSLDNDRPEQESQREQQRSPHEGKKQLQACALRISGLASEAYICCLNLKQHFKEHDKSLKRFVFPGGTGAICGQTLLLPK